MFCLSREKKDLSREIKVLRAEMERMKQLEKLVVYLILIN